MTDAQTVSRTDLLQAVVGVCAFGGVFLFMWAAASGYGPALVLAVALWIVGGVLSVGVDDAASDGVVGSHTDDGWAVTRRGTVGSAAGRQKTVGSAAGAAGPEDRTSADALEMLRERYARGELSDEQFDRKLDRLTETRTLEDATDAYEREESTGG